MEAATNYRAAPATTPQFGVGSLISVISISENRYEGFLIDINVHHIGLRNVKFFGTEGRLEYGPQISASDKIYEYIYLRGSNIKDLQVIASPSPQSTSVIPEDPAIIGPRFLHPTPTTMASTSHDAAEVANVSTSAQPILPVTSFQLNQPSDPSASSSSFWSSLLSPPPANISRLAVPNFLSGLVGSLGRMSHFQQQFPPPPLNLVASQAPVQQLAQHLNVNTSVVVGSSFYEHQHPLLPEVLDVNDTLAPVTDKRISVELIGASPMTIEEQSEPWQSSPSQSLQTTDTASVTELLPSDSTEETPESLLQFTTETGCTSSHHDKGTQSAQGRDQNRRVIRRFKEDFDFQAMNEKFNKKEVWDFFSKKNKAKADDGGDLKGKGREIDVKDNSKPVYIKEEFFDYLSYSAPEPETLSEQRKRDNETFGAEIPLLHQDHWKGPHSAGTSFGGRAYGNVRGSHRGPGRKVWRPVLK